MRVRIIPTLLLYIDMVDYVNTFYSIRIQGQFELRQYEKPPFFVNIKLLFVKDKQAFIGEQEEV